jgi:hypothetical protein
MRPLATGRLVIALCGAMLPALFAPSADELYLATLSRYPPPQEKQLAVSWIEKDRKQGAEDLHWSLPNKLDFIFNC